MLRSAKELTGYRIQAKDVKMGKIKDFYFDDQTWIIRYLVIDTGGWLKGRKILLSPVALENPDWMSKTLPINLTSDMVEKSPPIEAEKPVSRQLEINLHNYYGWTPYWTTDPFAVAPETPPMPVEKKQGDPHLRSVREVSGYHIQAMDGEIGHVEDFILEDASWTLRYMVVDTRNLLPGKKVIISPDWIDQVDWAQSSVKVDMLQQSIKESPEYAPSKPVNREYEIMLYDFYGRPKYWLR